MSATSWPAPTVQSVPSVGQFVLANSPNPELTAVRVFAPLPLDLRGSDVAHVLVELARERAQSLATRAGIGFSVSLAPDGIVYSATGTNADVDHLFAVVAEATSSPDDDRAAYARALEPVRQRREVDTETGAGWVTSTLSSRFCEGPGPKRLELSGTGAPTQRLVQHARAAWARSHAAPLPVVTVVSNLPQAVVFGGLDLIRSSLPNGSDGGAIDGELPPSPRAPRLLRVWFGTAFALPDSATATALVVGDLLDAAVASTSGDSELYAEIRTTPCGMALYTWGSSFPRDARAMRTRVRDFPTAMATQFDETAVARAANRVRLDVLVASDTPAGRAAAVASAYEGRTEMDGLVSELEGIDANDIRAFLGGLQDSALITAEVGR